MRRLLMLLLVLAVPAAWAEATQCTLGGLTRTVEVVYSSPPAQVPCEVIYSKPNEGETQTSLWNAQVEPGYCEVRAQGFVEKLEGLGWSCSGTLAGGEPAAASQN
jgi:hypothetical protein